MSRLATVERLANTGQSSWEGTPFEHSLDNVTFQGKPYSSKPPAYSFLMAAQVKVAYQLGFTKLTKDNLTKYNRLLILFNQGILFTLMLWGVTFFCLSASLSNVQTISVLIATGFGTLVFGYTSSLNNHVMAACYALLGFGAIFMTTRSQKAWVWGAVAGILLAMAASMEWLSTVTMLAGFALLLATKQWKASIAFAFAGAAVVSLSALYYYNVSGSPLPFQLQGSRVHALGSYWHSPVGHDALKDSKLRYLWESLFGFKGLFLYSPIMLIWPVAFIHAVSRKPKDWFHTAFLFASIAAILIITLVVLRTQNYGGWCIGMRWFIQFSPLVLLFSLIYFRAFLKHNWALTVIILLALLSLPPNFEALQGKTFGISQYEWWLRPEIMESLGHTHP